jgi:hypothetical protein
LQVFASDLAQEQHKFLINMEEGFEKLLPGSVSSKQASKQEFVSSLRRLSLFSRSCNWNFFSFSGYLALCYISEFARGEGGINGHV